ncbi:MAG: RHS repeat protein [Nitrospinae bacterium]|nr:RHS repeat protein [Nitrospinota bacterium]
MAYSYDASGDMSSVTDSAGNVMNYAYDTAGRKIGATLPDGRTISYTFDANGNIASITPPSRPAHGFTYTPVNLESQYVPPSVADSGTTNTTYAYNLDKQVTSITRPDGQTVNYVYGTDGRVSSVNMNGASLSFTYNSNGQCCGGSDNPSTIVRTDAAGRSESLAYVYDGKLQTSTTWSGEFNASLAWTFNNDLRPTTQSINGAHSVSFGYDADGMLTSAGALAVTRNAQNGHVTGASLGSMATTAGYNTFGELTAITAKYAASTMYDVQHTRDVSGRITRKVETLSGVATTYDYTYDAAGRLVGVSKNGVQSSSYTYDANGNRIAATTQGGTVSGGYDSQDRLLSYGAASYAYTANGELSGKTVNGLQTLYSYDALGNLVSATLPDGTLIEYIIDGENRRVGKKVNGVLTQGLVYENALEPVAELDGTGSVIARYVYATRENVPDYMIKGGVTYRIVSDHLGSPRLVVNITDGSVVQRMDYDEFGNITNDTNPGFQPFGFAGGIYDQHTKLTRHGARDYDAETGRWTAKDPIKFKGGDTNLFGYVNNDPVDFYDLKGLKGCGPGGIHVDPSGMVGECCDKHDNCYEKQCNVSQQDCDDAFCLCLRQKCQKASIMYPIQGALCKVEQLGYCAGVNYTGHRYYH